MSTNNQITIYSAMQASDRGIGKDNALLFKISEDLRRFKQLTVGHPVMMGRKTYDATGALRNRVNIVLSRDPSFAPDDDIIVVRDFDEALKEGWGRDQNLFVIGGGEIFEQALQRNIVDCLELTIVNANKEADTFFPD